MEPIMVEGGKGAVALEANEVIHLVWKPSVGIEAVDAHAAMTAVDEIADGSEYPMLVDMAATESTSIRSKLSPAHLFDVHAGPMMGGNR
ncbi:hypothetical protein [Arthrobacter sp. UYCu712]|uniref:hypothetical protein n=1 Tax=Arthrobacter sp. UYCu712 TaxID=3156340 RepID=UPI00339B0366